MISANIPNSVRKAIYKRDGYRCALCDSNRGLQIHHVMKRSQGGSNSPHNLITNYWKEDSGRFWFRFNGSDG